MSKNILLINPWIYDFAAYDFWLKPLGLLYLGSLLRRTNHQVHFIDCLDPYHPDMQAMGKKPQRHAYGDGKFFRQVIEKPEKLKMISRNYCRYGITPDIFRHELVSHQDADIVLVTSLMTYWYPGVVEAIRIIKEALPHAPVVLGGKYATLCYDHALQYSGADYVIRGSGERQILQLVKKIFAEKQSFDPDMEDLDTLPYPAFDLVRNLEQVPLITSRGCPFHCSYCASHILNDQFRRRNPLKVVDEIEYWQKNFNVKNFTFYDDALLVNPTEMITLLLREVAKRNLSCNFHCPNGLHLREINKEISQLLYNSGFKTIRFGFETSDFNRQMETGGKVKNEELKRAVRQLKSAGYQTDDIGIYLLCGLPGQRAKEVSDSIEFVRDCGAKPVLAEYSPIPGTKMWDEAVALSPFDIQGEPLYHNNTLLPCRNNDFSVDVYDELKRSLRKKHGVNHKIF
ncbi:MAG: B12-binding domain-containing radical SAM protein [Smithellaceae bacterium]